MAIAIASESESSRLAGELAERRKELAGRTTNLVTWLRTARRIL